MDKGIFDSGGDIVFGAVSQNSTRVFVQKRHPKTSVDANKLADDYIQVRREEIESKNREKGLSLEGIVSFCYKFGRMINKCRVSQNS